MNTALKNAKGLDDNSNPNIPPSKKDPNTRVYILVNELLDILDRPQ